MSARSQPSGDAKRAATNAAPSAAWTPDRCGVVRSMILDGLSHAQIAARLGLTRDTVSSGIRRYALSPGAVAPEKAARKDAPDLWTVTRLTERWAGRRRA